MDMEVARLQRQVKKYQKRVEYHRNKENKFLFFLFSLQNKGIPVNEIYESEGIKDIPTSRFGELMGEDTKGTNQSSMMFSFYSDDSYEPIQEGPDPALLKEKPKCVPQLNLLNIPQYDSSSDEEGNKNDISIPMNKREH
eukprot:CAMPEP_0202970272 /NCGR_PEP_ID=MMETSP1396-20130829/16251_1 /ASSEMBLY_ACC=CAM_ASM_000872 /TAXON_ID= /ORGANISM="Pseudokeronopsis sp., Strain Brazil" /LENGTH=138 /DNA_ID=CAMNT_0049698671 /DNA_START=270 /DNA_END=686 /DNA_ORIENTATION=-